MKNAPLLCLTLVLCLWAASLSAQPNRALVWHFGRGVSLSFDQGDPYFLSGSNQFTVEGCAGICDIDGKLLFYTNGGGRDPMLPNTSAGIIWNKNHQEMYNMSYTEGGGYSSAQSAVAFPAPGSQTRYFLFTMEEGEYDVGGSVPSQPLGRGLSFFEIDMDLNGGLGEVTDYQEAIYLPTYEGLCAIQHANGQDYWIVVLGEQGQSLVVLPVSADGPGVPSEIATGPFSYLPIKSSPDGKWLTVGGATSLHLFPFNNETGTVGAPVILPGQSPRTEFSPNGRYLFLTAPEVTRYDLTAANIAATETSIGALPVLPDALPFIIAGNPQLGPNGKIYFPSIYVTLTGDELEFLSVIECPNGGGELLPNVLPIALNGNGNLFFSLPNYPAQWFYQSGLDPMASPSDTVVTPGSPVQLMASNGATYEWSPAALLSCSDCPDPIAVAEESATIYVWVEDPSGCRALDSVRIVVEEEVEEDCRLEIPNAFTPDGDQVNDLFRPLGADGPYHLRIWNRWGGLVFDNGGAGAGWNGMHDGQPAPSDVYVWILDVEICGERKRLKGETTLLR
jgi:gliding motility-associated-like protein